jgi:hypothetical protein
MYTITIASSVLAPGGALYQLPYTQQNYEWVGGIGFVPITPAPAPSLPVRQKAKLLLGVLGNYATVVNEQLSAEDAIRTISITADGTCTLQDEEMQGLDIPDRLALANYIQKGLAIVTLNGGAPMTAYAVASLPHL